MQCPNPARLKLPRFRGVSGDLGVTSVKMVGIRVSFAVAMNHAAMVAIWVGAASMVGAMSSAIGSVCM